MSGLKVFLGWLKSMLFVGAMSVPWPAPSSASFDAPAAAAAGSTSPRPGLRLQREAVSAAGRFLPLPVLHNMSRWQAYLRTRYDHQPHVPLALVAHPPPEAAAGGPAEPADADEEALFVAAYRAAVGSPAGPRRQQFLDTVWRDRVAARLPEEEASMQMVAHYLAYMHWTPGQRLPLAIATSQVTRRPPAWEDGTPVAYARQNVVREVLPAAAAVGAARDAVAAFWFEPDNDQPGPAIILFRGTDLTGADVLARGGPSGFHHDIDWRGVGHGAFAGQRETLQRWLRASLADGRGVVLVGHSLGGSLAARLLASLAPDEQARTRLLAFAPAGLESACTDAIVPAPGRIIIALDADDLVPACGARLPPATVLETHIWSASQFLTAHRLVATHVRPALAEALLGWRLVPAARQWSSARIHAPPAMLPEVVRVGLLWPLGKTLLYLATLFPSAGEPPELAPLPVPQIGA